MARILIVLATNERRGAEVEGMQLAAELCRAGHAAEVVALCATAPEPLEVAVLGGSALSPATLRALRRRAASVDCVIAYGSTALPACAIALLGSGSPFVYRSIGDPVRWVRGGWHRRRTGLLLRRAAHVVALWPAAAEAIHRLYLVPTSRITCIANARPSPVETAPPDRAAARAELGLPAEGTVVAWVGALSPEKRPLLAIEAVAACDGAFLALAGEGPLRAEVGAACERQLAGRHRLLGVVSPLAPLWAAADVVLLTSSTEGMPGVLIEAALQGVPAVASEVGAVDQVVIDGATGRLVPADGDGSLFAGALAEAVGRRPAWGAAARAHAGSMFTWQHVLPSWLDLVALVVTPPDDRSPT